MKKFKAKFTGKKGSKKQMNRFDKEQFGKLENKGMMKRWGKNKNMGRGRT